MLNDEIKKLQEIGITKLQEIAKDLTVEEFLLTYSKENGFPVALAADQIRYHDKLCIKLPLFEQKELLVTGRSFEQASSQATALYKCSRMSGDSIIDLTGGLGVDSIFLSKKFKTSYYCEMNEDLFQITDYNFKKLALQITNSNGDGIEYLKQFDDNSFDWIFIDPSRRVEGKRVTALSHCEPDVTKLMELFFLKTKNICIKAAPAYDISMALKEISGIHEISVISYQGECREVLIFCSKEENNNVVLRSVIVEDDGSIFHELVSDARIKRCWGEVCNLKRFFYVPDPVIFKTGQFDLLAKKYNLSFINSTVGYLSGDECISDFPGKRYKVVDQIQWSRKSVNKYLKEKGIAKASVARRDFPLDPKGLRKMLGLSDGGVDYLFFTKNHEGKKVCIHCIKD